MQRAAGKYANSRIRQESRQQQQRSSSSTHTLSIHTHVANMSFDEKLDLTGDVSNTFDEEQHNRVTLIFARGLPALRVPGIKTHLLTTTASHITTPYPVPDPAAATRNVSACCMHDAQRSCMYKYGIPGDTYIDVIVQTVRAVSYTRVDRVPDLSDVYVAVCIPASRLSIAISTSGSIQEVTRRTT